MQWKGPGTRQGGRRDIRSLFNSGLVGPTLVSRRASMRQAYCYHGTAAPSAQHVWCMEKCARLRRQERRERKKERSREAYASVGAGEPDPWAVECWTLDSNVLTSHSMFVHIGLVYSIEMEC